MNTTKTPQFNNLNPIKMQNITATDKVTFNAKQKRNVYTTALVSVNSHWFFENGNNQNHNQKEGYEFYLTYFYDRVYFNYRKYNSLGFRSKSIQMPLEKVTKIGWYDIAKQLFDADKKCGVMKEEYEFK